jgi:hypothetical protein
MSYARSLDSLAALDFKARLGDRYLDFDIKAPEKTIDEAYRVHTEFGWGVSPVGAIFSVLAEKSGTRHSMQIYTLPNGKRSVFTKEITADEFKRISRTFDSIDFENQPLLLKVDFTRYDASKYVLESFKRGSYHAISRSDSVDLYVYKLLADFAAIAGVSPELVKDFRQKARGDK